MKKLSSSFALLLIAVPSVVGCDRDSSTVAPANAGSDAMSPPAPDFELPKRGGESLSLSSLQGQVVLVDFWASWCDPCQDELPALTALYDKHREAGFVIVAVNIDEERAAADEFLSRVPVSYPVVYDASHEVADAWKPPKMPTSYLIDQEGRIAHVQAGYEPGDLEELDQRIVGLLAR